ncbi:MAG: exosortase/archaeosortase family protein [Gemmataceae bacterium]
MTVETLAPTFALRKPQIAALVLLGVGLSLFAPTLATLVRTWEDDPSYSHGFLVLPFCAFLVFRYAAKNPITERGEGLLGALYVLAGTILHLATVVSGYLLLDFPAMVLVLRGLALCVGGRSWANGLTVPFLFLFFMFPLPVSWTSIAALWLQEIVARAASALVSIFFVTFRRGNAIHIAGLENPLYVAEECSGLRQLVAFFALGCALAYFSRRPWYSRLALIVASAPVAIVSNVLRVFLMALGARWFGVAWLSGWMHHVPAAITLPIGLMLFLLVAWLLPGSDPSQEPGVAPPEAPASDEPSRWAPAVLVAPIACLVLAFGLQAGLLVHLTAAENQTYPELRAPLAALPLKLAQPDTKAEVKTGAPLGWWGVERSKADPAGYERLRGQIKFSHAEILSRFYGNGIARPSVELYMVYSREGEDRKHHPDICMRDVGGMPEAVEKSGPVFLDKEKRRVAMRLCYRVGTNRFTTVYYWHYTFDANEAETETVLQRIHRRSRGAAPSITVQVSTMETGTALEAIEKELLPALDGALLRAHLPPGTKIACDRLPISLRD